MNSPSHSARTKKKMGLVVAAALLSVVGSWLWLRHYNSPDAVAARAADAFRRHDIAAFLNMTSPEEKKAMNLTQDTVTKFLNQTVYATGTVTRFEPNPTSENEGERMYGLTFTTPHHKSQRVVLVLMPTPRGDWTLALSYTLYKFYERAHVEDADAMQHLIEITQAAGIRGIYSKSGITYVDGQIQNLPGQSIYTSH